MIGVLGAVQCLAVVVWPTFPYDLAVSRSFASNCGRFHWLGGVNAPINTLVHICRHYGVSTDVLRQSKVLFLEINVYICWHMVVYAHIYRYN